MAKKKMDTLVAALDAIAAADKDDLEAVFTATQMFLADLDTMLRSVHGCTADWFKMFVASLEPMLRECANTVEKHPGFTSVGIRAGLRHVLKTIESMPFSSELPFASDPFWA